MDLSPQSLLLVFAVQMLAYTVKGLVGFGNPLISAPLLSMRLDNVVITPGTLLMDIPVNGYLTWKNRRSVDWRRVLPLLAAMVAGVVPGTLLLRYSLPWVLKTVLGVVVVGLGIEMATRRGSGGETREKTGWRQYLVAFFSGMCAGLYGISMFIVAYLQRTARDYSQFKGSMCCLFFGENVFRLCVYLAAGLIGREVLFFALASLPAAALSMVLSGWLGRRLDQKKLMPAAIALFILGGVSIIVKSLPV